MGSTKSTSKNKNAQEKEKLESETFYKNLTNKDLNDVTSPKQQVELHFEITLAEINTEYSMQIFLDTSGKPITDKKKSNDDGIINFDSKFILDYYFEKQQNITLKIKKDSKIFEIKTTLGNVMGSRRQVLTKDIEKEKLIISANALKNNGTNLLMNVKIENIKLTHLNPLFYIFKKANNMNSKDSWINIYKSEVQNPKNKQYTFSQVKIPESILMADSESHFPLQIEVWDFKTKALLGTDFIKLNISTGTNSNNIQGYLVTNNCSFIKDYNFIDFLQGGLQLAMTVGIDFTGSNGHPNDAISLHHVGGNNPNDYERAIRSCGSIVAYYDYDQLFPVYGYGAILPGQKDVSFVFPINLSTDPNIYSIENVLTTYRNIVTKISFSGPTLFAPLISKAVNSIKQSESKNVYNVLLILTDGNINDMNETIDALVEASYLPISVIIVGIGNSDFSNMEQLDADIEPLIDRKGRKAIRDIVQFVPFHKFVNDGIKLAEQVLEEVPSQVVEYHNYMKIIPGNQ